MKISGDVRQAIWTGTNDRSMYHYPSNLEPRCIHLHDWYSTRDISGLLLVVREGHVLGYESVI